MRIVGGVHRGRLLTFPDLEGLRPTPDRVRETLFNWLGQDLAGWSCLDLFAGSGALGFEALSRGASHVTLVEHDPRAWQALKDNAERLAGSASGGKIAPELEIVRCDAIKFADSPPRRYDLILLDPPFRQGWLERLEPLLDRVASAGACIYAEAEREIVSLGRWRPVRHKKAGQVHYQLMQAGEPC